MDNLYTVFMTAQEVADMLNYSKRTIYNMRTRGVLRGIQLVKNGKILFIHDDVINYIRNRDLF